MELGLVRNLIPPCSRILRLDLVGSLVFFSTNYAASQTEEAGWGVGLGLDWA